MAEFRFRAAAALELRTRQETAASTALATAEAGLRAAEADAAQADADRRNAQDQQTLAERRGLDVATLLWHRHWVSRLGDLVDRARAEVERHEAIVRTAEAAWREARRKRLVLDRMRDRAFRRFQDDERRREMKAIDELARLRFVLSEDQLDRR